MGIISHIYIFPRLNGENSTYFYFDYSPIAVAVSQLPMFVKTIFFLKKVNESYLLFDLLPDLVLILLF